MKKALVRSLFRGIVIGAIVLHFAGSVLAEEAQPTQPQAQQPVTPTQPTQPQVQQTQSQSAPTQAQQPAPAIEASTMINGEGKKRLYLFGDIGFGFEHPEVGQASGDSVKISAGGGVGGGVGFGYGLSKSFDLDLELGVQASTINPPVSNATGAFTRSFLLGTIKYKVPTADTGRFKFGAGIGSYGSGKLDVDTVDAGGSHVIVKYENAVGVHMTGEFERFISPTTSVNIGAKMYFVTYKAKSMTINGAVASVDTLPGSEKNYNGSGFDFMIGISKYFD